MATGAWPKLPVRWYSCYAVFPWGSILKETTQGKMALFFQEKLSSATVICFYKYRHSASSSEGAFFPHSFITFSHVFLGALLISRFSSTFGALHGVGDPILLHWWGSVFSKWASGVCHCPLFTIEMIFKNLLSIGMPIEDMGIANCTLFETANTAAY